jgi:DNA-binding response OmpR family regulator
MLNILIVEDEVAINDLIMMNLKLATPCSQGNGYNCLQAYDGNEAVTLFNEFQPDLIILDVMIPYKDGFTLMEQNVFGETPVIFLTAKDSTQSRVKGLNLGADDYIVKPFEMVELLARVDAVLRRVKPTQRIFTIGNVSVNLQQRIVTNNEQNVTIDLTKQEFDLLEVLINNRNIALSRDKLLTLAWGYDYFGDARTVDVHITKLRKKLALDNYIKTVYKLGYRLEVQ